MLGLYVSVPVACFRKGLAREYLETEPLPPPSTCYGFLLSLVGEMDRRRHAGCRVAPALLNTPARSVVLRTVWRCKDRNYYVDPTGKHHVVSTQKKARDAFVKWAVNQGWPEPEFDIGLGTGTNARPDFQQLLAPVELAVWLDSSGELCNGPTLANRVRNALDKDLRGTVERFGGLSLGESTHLVDEVMTLERYRGRKRPTHESGRAFLLAERGRLTLPVWVDHVGSAGTRHVTGDLKPVALAEGPAVSDMPVIQPPAP